MSNDKAFPKKQLVAGIVIGLLVNVAYTVLAPRSTRLADQPAMIEWAVPFLLFLGGYAIFRKRGTDLEYYKSIAPDTEEARLHLGKRYRLLGIAGWVFTGAGAIRTAVILFHEFSR